MDIRFCDICNESVPLADLAEGRAATHKGRVVCASCQLAMSPRVRSERGVAVGERELDPVGDGNLPAGATPAEASPGVLPKAGAGSAPSSPGPTQTTAAASSAGPMALALLALVGVTAAAFLTRRELEETAQRAALGRGLTERALMAELNRRTAIWEGELAQLRMAQQAERERQSAFEVAMVAALERVALAQEQAERQGAERSSQLRAEWLASIEAEGEQRKGGDFAGIEARLEQLTADVGVLARTLLDTLDREPTPAAPAPEPAPAPAWEHHLEGLSAADPLVRWGAVDALSRAGDPAAGEHLVPLLSDADLFVRMAAARALGELGSAAAVPRLIDALEDSEASVREAALFALRTITGRNLPLDPSGSVAERARQVAEWRAWWRRSGGLASGGG